jgi:hypothetical protein
MCFLVVNNNHCQGFALVKSRFNTFFLVKTTKLRDAPALSLMLDYARWNDKRVYLNTGCQAQEQDL